MSGARNIIAKNGFCGFSSHGLSIGSLGRYGVNATVANVLFKNWTMSGAVYGARVSYHSLSQVDRYHVLNLLSPVQVSCRLVARNTLLTVIRSWTGGAGWAENVTWQDITLVDVSTGVFITQK